MDNLYIKDESAVESDTKDENYVKSESYDEDFDSQIKDSDLESFISEGRNESSEELPSIVENDDSENFIDKNENRNFIKLKKGGKKAKDNDSFKVSNEDDFIVDDIYQDEDKDDYTLEIKGPTHTSEAMSIVTSIFGDVTDFLLRKSPFEYLKQKENFENEKIIEKDIEIDDSKIPQKIIDIPDRLSKRIPTLASIGPSELEIFLIKASKFIYRKFYAKNKGILCQEKILEVLLLIFKEKFEIPFLSLYSNGQWKSFGFSDAELWQIFNSCGDFFAINKRQEKIRNFIEEKIILRGKGKIALIDFVEKFADSQIDLADTLAYVCFLKACVLNGNNEDFLQAFGQEFYSAEYQFERLKSRISKNANEIQTKVERINSKNEQKEANIEQKVSKNEENKLKNEQNESKNGQKVEKIPQNRKKLNIKRRIHIRMTPDLMALISFIGTSNKISEPILKVLELKSFKTILKNGVFEKKSEKIDEKDNNDIELNELAKKCIGSVFSDKESAIEKAAEFLAKDIGRNPIVKKLSKILFLKKAVVSTEPTAKGKKDINWLHPYLIVKRIIKKPVQKFINDLESKENDVLIEQYSVLNDALNNGYITRKIFIPDSKNKLKYGKIESILREFYIQSEKNSETVALKQKIITKALDRHIIPACEKYAHSFLLEKSNQRIASNCATTLSKRLETRGIDPKGSFVFAINLGNFKEPSFCAIVSSDGLLIDYTTFSNLKLRSRRKLAVDQNSIVTKKSEDLNLLKNLILEHSPSIIVVSAMGTECDSVLEDIEKVCSVSSKNIRCELIDPEIARIFERSKRAENEFFEYPCGLRNAIALARSVIDPVSEIAYMASSHNSANLLSLRLDFNQKLVPSEMLFKSLEEVIFRSVNKIGVDVNSGVLIYPHKKAILNYICGFNSKITNFLCRKSNGLIENREELKKLLSNYPKIFENSVPFIKLMPCTQLPKTNLLDRSRIHPNQYSLLEKVLQFALELGDSSKQSLNKMVKKASKNLKVMINFNQEACFENFNLVSNKKEGEFPLFNKKLISFLVKEIQTPFECENLKDFKKLTSEELFWLVSGESPRTLRVGQLVTITISSIKDKYAICQMDCDIFAVLPADRVFNDDDTNNLGENSFSLMKSRLKPGMTLRARISEIIMEIGRFKISLDARKSSIESQSHEEPAAVYYPRRFDRYLDVTPDEPEDHDEKENSADVAPQRAFVPRKVDFPFFKNISREEAEKELEEKDAGSLIVRPSSRGINFLTATWKISRDPFICVHIEIKEKNKPNAFSIGRSLEINSMHFEDLDEIYARFFERMTQKMAAITSFRRFRFGTEKEVEQLVLFEKKEHRNSVPYSIGFSLKHPGCLLLFYVFSVSIKKEYIVVLPQGYRFRNKVFKTPESMIQWFKKNPYKNSPYRQKREDASQMDQRHSNYGNGNYNKNNDNYGNNNDNYRNNNDNYGNKNYENDSYGSSYGQRHYDRDKYGAQPNYADQYGY